MPLTRREFLGRSLVVGASMVAAPACSRSGSPPGKGEDWQPAYQRLAAAGKLDERIEQAQRLFDRCTLCPRRCGVNRRQGNKGYCRAPLQAVVSSHQAHFGEEVPLVGRRGSGTIFFANCNLRCVFCQNWPIAHEGRGRPATAEDIAGMMLNLQRRGCHNINLVTPTHVMPNILAALRPALEQGLRLPLVYNTGGYECREIIELLDGIVDIYMPDLKFMDSDHAQTYLKAPDYPQEAQPSIREMYRQVGPLKINDDGLAYHGLMIRHLVMPNRVSGAREFVRWVADELSPDVYVNIMSQYRVDFRAYEYEKIARAIQPGEFIEAINWAKAAGLKNLDSRSVSQYALFQRRGG